MLEKQKQEDPWSQLACQSNLVATLIRSPCLQKLNEQLRKILEVNLRLPHAHINTNTYTKEVTRKVYVAKILANFGIRTRNFRRQDLVFSVSPSRDSRSALASIGLKGVMLSHTVTQSYVGPWHTPCVRTEAVVSSQERSRADVT